MTSACGIINDHGCDCPRYAVVNATTETVRKRRTRDQGIVNFGIIRAKGKSVFNSLIASRLIYQNRTEYKFSNPFFREWLKVNV